MTIASIEEQSGSAWHMIAAVFTMQQQALYLAYSEKNGGAWWVGQQGKGQSKRPLLQRLNRFGLA